MKHSRTSTRSCRCPSNIPFALSVFVLLVSAGAAAEALGDSWPCDASCVEVKASNLAIPDKGDVSGTLSAHNRCPFRIVLLLSPVQVEVARLGKRIPWMGVESRRNAFARLVLMEQRVDVDRAFAGDGARNVYAPLLGVTLETGADASIPVVGHLPKGVTLGPGPGKALLLLPCLRAPAAIDKTSVLDLASSVGRLPSTPPRQEPIVLPGPAVLIHVTIPAVVFETSK